MHKKQLILLMTVIALGILVSACAGGASQATSWPGLTVDPSGEVGYISFETSVYAVNLANGTEIWHFPAEKDNKISFYAAPALTEDGQLIVGDYSNILYSINPENGQQNWTFDGSENRYVAGALANGDSIYAPSTDKNLYSLDLTGSPTWEFTSGDALWGTSVTDGELVFLPGMDHYVYALDAVTGQEVWKTESLGGSVAGQPTLSPDGSILYVGTYGNELLALSTANGQVQWRMPAANWVWSGPALSNGTLFVGDVEGNFYSVDAQSGGINWNIQPDPENDSAITGKPLVIGEAVYFTSQNGSLYVVDVANGNPLWSKAFDGELFAPPKAAGEDTLLVTPTGVDELLVAFSLDGVQKWVFIPAD